TTVFYTLSLHDALPIFRFFIERDTKTQSQITEFIGCPSGNTGVPTKCDQLRHALLQIFPVAHHLVVLAAAFAQGHAQGILPPFRSEEHTSELQSPYDLV